MLHSHTICATATAPGVGALGIIRISGDDSILLVNKIFKGRNLENVASHTVHYGYIIDQITTEIIDEVMVSVFKAPKTFTTEDLVEISCHGSPYIKQQIIALLLKNGVRLAHAGEFTQRAFLGGRIDLSQAEAVADLIASENKASHQIALNQMRGGITNELNQFRESLINLTALIELELDFAEEDVNFADRGDLFKLCLDLEVKLLGLIDSFTYGNALKNGVPVAIIGKPNAGKSSLLNKLLNDERAIVSAIAGTTRDTIEENLVIDGINFRFIDTAGLRQTTDEIETKGIERAFEKIKQSQIIIYLFDKGDTSFEEVISDLEKIPEDKTVILCPSKMDLYLDYNWEEWFDKLNEHHNLYTSFLGISSKLEEYNFTLLKSSLVESVMGNADPQGVIISNLRHKEALENAYTALVKVHYGLDEGLSGDLLSFHLKETIRYIGSITGEIEVDKDILGTIFGKFCIGK